MNLVKRLKKYSLLEWLFFGIIFSMNSPWIVWANNLSSIIQYSCVFLSLIIVFKDKRSIGPKEWLIFVLLIAYFVLGQVFHEVRLSYLFICGSYLLASKIKLIEASNLINLVTSYLFLSIIIPLPLWLIHIYISPLPTIGIIEAPWKEGVEFVYENHFFFLTVEGLEAMRFYSWYDEPGVLGTIAAFVLWANNYNLKDKRIIVILIGSLLTFSIAYYILLVLGWLYNSIGSMKKFIISSIVFALIGFVAYSLLKDNIAFEQSVVNRIIDYDEYGLQARTSDDVDVLWKRSLNNNDLIWGLGSGTVGIARSYKNFVIEFGFVGFFILIIAYFSLIKKRNIKSLFTLFLFVLAFLQRPQMFTAYEFVLFSCIVTLIADEYKQKKTGLQLGNS